MLGWRSQARETTHRPIPFVCEVQNRPVCTNRRQISGCQRLVGGEEWSDWLMIQGVWGWGNENVLELVGIVA